MGHKETIRRWRALRRSEDGSVIIFGVMISVMVLFFAGLAVDLMRTESARAKLQGALDRGMLAAADVDQKADRRQVVKEYMTAMGLAKWLVGEPTYEDGTVSAAAKMDVSTIFANFTDKFAVGVAGSATNKVAESEIALVLDISGSMGRPAVDEDGNSTGRTRIQELQRAANSFMDTVLAKNDGKTSVSIVPFSEQVAVSKALFDGLKTNKLHDFGYCISFAEDDFRTVGIDPNRTYPQSQQAQFHYVNRSSQIWAYMHCPVHSVGGQGDPRVRVHSDDKAGLQAYVNGLNARAQTSIHYGMKWAAMLLDPSFRPVSQAMSSAGEVPARFAARPLAYNSGLKAIVLLTDGTNTTTYKMRDEYYNGSKSYEERKQVRKCRSTWWGGMECWYEYQTITHTYNPQYWYNNSFGDWLQAGLGRPLLDQYGYEYMRPTVSTRESANRMMKMICDAAKAKGIVIYGVGVSLEEIGRTPMQDCVSSPSHYFDVRGGELNDAFQSIAEDFVALRLSR